jgi:transcriptional regulator with XRE-family HTH domain
MAFADRLKALREQKDMTQQELAVKAGLAVSIVTKLEGGQTTDPRWSTVCALADALEVSISELRDPRRRGEKG